MRISSSCISLFLHNKEPENVIEKKIGNAMSDAHFAVFTVQISLVLNGKYKAMNFSTDIITSNDDE